MRKVTARSEAELIELVRSSDVRAPDTLHNSVHALIANRTGAPGWRLALRCRDPLARGLPVGRWGLAVAFVGLTVTLVLVAALVAGGGRAFTVREVAAATLRPATTAAPAQDGNDPAELAATVDGVAFPYWARRFGWRASGERTDRVAGRTIITVFYVDSRGRRLGYAIAADTSPPPLDGAVAWRGRTSFHPFMHAGAEAVAWLRAGHLCVVSGRGLDSTTLLRLASWSGGGARLPTHRIGRQTRAHVGTHSPLQVAKPPTVVLIPRRGR
jgi:hypothetical protein